MHINTTITWKEVTSISDIFTIDRIISKAYLKKHVSIGYKIYENDEYIILALEKINDKLYQNFLIIPKENIINEE